MQFFFSQNTTVETLDNVPTQYHKLYTQTDEGFKLNEDFSEVGKIIDGLRTSIKKERAAKATDLSTLAEYGDTPESIAESFSNKIKELESAMNSKTKEQLENMRKDIAGQYEQKFGQEKQKMEAMNQALTKQLNKVMVEAEAIRAIAEHKGDPELLMPFVKASVKVETTNDQDNPFKVVVVDPETGTARGNLAGGNMSISERVAEMKGEKRYQKLFDSEAPSGGGAVTTQRTSTKRPAGAEKSPKDKIASGLATGQKSFGVGVQ